MLDGMGAKPTDRPESPGTFLYDIDSSHSLTIIIPLKV
jgi:hypothetical protein